jgi:hypothetical protein
MSEIKLNLLDSHTLLTATVHGSVGDALVGALSAEPETIVELEAALKRFKKCDSIPASFLRRQERGPIDEQPWDAGILVIDLPARFVACESTYSQPTHKGKVAYTTALNQQAFHFATGYQTTGSFGVQSLIIKPAVISESKSVKPVLHSILAQFSTAYLFTSSSSRMCNSLTRRQSEVANNIAKQLSTFTVAG